LVGAGNEEILRGRLPARIQEALQTGRGKHGHADRWRDTFSVELLLAGVPLEQVSVLLGHQSIKVTQKHYSPFVKARQEQLEAAVRNTFSATKTATNHNDRQ
jgi:site-specific recombinase XerD